MTKAEVSLCPLEARYDRGLDTRYEQMGWVVPARADLCAAVELDRDIEMMLWLSQAEAALEQTLECIGSLSLNSD